MARWFSVVGVPRWRAAPRPRATLPDSPAAHHWRSTVTALRHGARHSPTTCVGHPKACIHSGHVARFLSLTAFAVSECVKLAVVLSATSLVLKGHHPAHMLSSDQFVVRIVGIGAPAATPLIARVRQGELSGLMLHGFKIDLKKATGWKTHRPPLGRPVETVRA